MFPNGNKRAYAASNIDKSTARSSSGVMVVGRKTDLEIFDALPQSLRELVREASIPYASEAVREMLVNEYDNDAEAMAERLRKSNRIISREYEKEMANGFR